MTKKFGWTKNILIHQIESNAYEKYLLNQTNFNKALAKEYRHQPNFGYFPHQLFCNLPVTLFVQP